MRTLSSGKLHRAIAVAGASSVIGVAQYGIASDGMRTAAHASGLDGIGVALGYGISGVLLTLISLSIGSRLLGLGRWAVTAAATTVADGIVLILMWELAERAGLEHHWRAAAFIFALEVPALINADIWADR